MKKAYFVIDSIDNDKKYFTVVCPINYGYDNVINKLQNWVGNRTIEYVLLAESKKNATEIYENWKNTHKLNNEYIDEMNF